MSPTDANPFLADNTAEDWDDEQYVFYAVDEHGKDGLARKNRERYPSGRPKPIDPIIYVHCKEHHTFEPRYRHITGIRALSWMHERRSATEEGTETG